MHPDERVVTMQIVAALITLVRLSVCVVDVSISLILRFNEDQPLLASFTIDKSHCLIDVENPWFMFLCYCSGNFWW